MANERLLKAYRSWIGFRLMFSGTDLKLDSDLVPVVKIPKADSRQKHAVLHNISKVLRKAHEDTFPLFFVATALRNHGEIPYPLSILDEKTISMMHRCLKEMFDILSGLDDECRVLWKEKHDYDSLLRACIEGRISVPAAACYAANFKIEKLDIGMVESLEIEQIQNVFDVALKLEKTSNFFKKYRLLVQRSLHRFGME